MKHKSTFQEVTYKEYIARGQASRRAKVKSDELDQTEQDRGGE